MRMYGSPERYWYLEIISVVLNIIDSTKWVTVLMDHTLTHPEIDNTRTVVQCKKNCYNMSLQYLQDQLYQWSLYRLCQEKFLLTYQFTTFSLTLSRQSVKKYSSLKVKRGSSITSTCQFVDSVYLSEPPNFLSFDWLNFGGIVRYFRTYRNIHQKCKNRILKFCALLSKLKDTLSKVWKIKLGT